MRKEIQWDELTPEQRNALVAEKVMALRVKHWTQKQVEVEVDGEPDIWNLRTGYVLADDPMHSPIPRYTTDMNAAWHIVEKLYEQFNVEIFVDLGMLSKYNTLVFERETIQCLGHGYSDTSMPEAICLAALWVIEGAKEK